jgi:hypothetical protein
LKAKAEEKKSGNVRRTRSASITEGHIPALLADICAVKVLADSGADDNVMSRLTARQLSVAGLFVPTKKLESPITLQLTAKDMNATAVEKARVNFTMQLDAGPLRLRNVEFLILDTEFEEVLLGRPLMKLLGIDVNAHLNSVRNEFHDHDFSDAPSLGQGGLGTISRILFMSHHDTNDNQFQNEEADQKGKVPAAATMEAVHPIPSHYKHGSVEDHAGISPIPSIPIGEDAEGEVAEALAKRVEVAVENGLPVLGVAELRSLLKQYECIFALKLGPQPPCAFPPLVVKMPVDAKPVRVRPRPMPAAKRQFVHDETAALAK